MPPKAAGAFLLFGCSAAFLDLAFESFDAGKGFRAGGYAGNLLAATLTEYFNRTGSVILILAAAFLAVIMVTQLSLGRIFAAAALALRTRLQDAWQRWSDARAERARARRILEEAGAEDVADTAEARV